MKRFGKISFVMAICFFVAISVGIVKAAETEGGSHLSISEAVLATGVENRVPISAGDTFEEGSRVYFFTWVAGGKVGDHITHVWIREEVEKFRINLDIGGPSWRTWSYKTMHPGSVGNWEVEARDEEGNVLETLSFECTPRAPQ